MVSTLYPPTPTAVSAALVQPSARYRGLVVLMLLSILLFAVLYLVLLAAACYAVYMVASFRFEHYSVKGLIFHLVLVGVTLMLPVFLLKFLFKLGGDDDNGYLPLDPAAHPDLFAFVRQLSAEAGVAMPRQILVNGQVNASVFYTNTLRSLVWPTPKNLLIGLGLVNGLNLTEFKAVLAHEFGHFGQRSMKLGSYVYAASRVIHDMVYERDKWDEVLADWRRSDWRVAWAGWLMTGVVWVVRKLLQLCYQGIHVVHASLSREMEFQADRVAVRLAGSDAICQALYRLGPTSGALSQARQQLGLALEHELATDDIFYHQTRYLTDMQPAAPAPAAASLEPVAEPQMLFRPDEVSVVEMYASHPADYLRELNAKRPFVPGPVDDRSPWLLFGTEAAALRQRVTATLYPTGASAVVRPAVEIEEFLQAERLETTYADHYAGTYDHRLAYFAAPADLPQLAADTVLPSHNLGEARSQLFGEELRQRTAAHAARLANLEKLALFQHGHTKDKQFTVDGVTYPAAEASAVASRLEAENKAYHAWLEQFDRQALALHWRLFREQPTLRPVWEQRYTFQYTLYQFSEAINETAHAAHTTVDKVSRHGELSPAQIQTYLSQFQAQHAQAQAWLHQAAAPLPPLAHLGNFATLSDFLVYDNALPGPVGFTSEWVGPFLDFLRTADSRVQRLYFKNLGALLQLQDQAAEASAATTEAAVSASFQPSTRGS
ncbi:M48 family metallopeptidase [Hymenobacter weizhouensis]|uniref:M48 family metallopeptidase n=1 Tax=Hymenobacter sp. YIM 151500-1 TaxID=2987689 RepID=UPI002226F390|nr:M48 family metallopeptidase [Hymenobacter sp. YIM 151500-1]UYZ62780.1 M48 family metallopeptidase [Hymenobacter sp. YIM 151500-1]